MLFILYLLPLGQVISQGGHPSASSSPSGTALSKLTACLKEIKAWINQNFLQLNSSKTEALLVGTPYQTRSSPITSIAFSGQDISLSSTVTNLCVRFDLQVTFESYFKHLSKTAFYHLRNIAKLRPTLTLPDAEKLVHAFVSSRLDYCNALLIGIPSRSLQRLQYIQNSADRILMRVRKYEHISPILHTLHWLPVSKRIEYKVSLLTIHCIHRNAPPYLTELLIPYTSARSLRSTNTHRLLSKH